MSARTSAYPWYAAERCRNGSDYLAESGDWSNQLDPGSGVRRGEGQWATRRPLRLPAALVVKLMTKSNELVTIGTDSCSRTMSGEQYRPG